VHSEDRHARVGGPSEGRVPKAHATISRACVGCIRFVAHARRRSPPRHPPDIRCHRRGAFTGGYPRKRRTDRGPRSDGAPRRAPPSRRPGCLSPPRHAKESIREGIAPSGLRAGSLAHAAHTLSSGWGQVLLLGIARSRCGHPRIRELRECRRLFHPLEPSRLGLTTQARQLARPTRPSTRTDCLARTDAGRNA
jgi:hypothetical protein